MFEPVPQSSGEHMLLLAPILGASWLTARWLMHLCEDRRTPNVLDSLRGGQRRGRELSNFSVITLLFLPLLAREWARRTVGQGSGRCIGTRCIHRTTNC